MTIHGSKGFAETHYRAPGVVVADDASKEPEVVPPAARRPGGYLDDFLACIRGEQPDGGLDPATCLAVSRLALELELEAAAVSH